jgi:hypothetical protein
VHLDAADAWWLKPFTFDDGAAEPDKIGVRRYICNRNRSHRSPK